MMMRSSHWISLLFMLVLLAGCQERDAIVQLNLPADYFGFVILVQDQQGVPLQENASGVISISVPEGGVVKVADLDVFEEWHRVERRFGDDLKAISYEHADRNGHLLYEIGRGTDGRGRAYQLFLIGTKREYDWYYKEGRGLTLNRLAAKSADLRATYPTSIPVP